MHSALTRTLIMPAVAVAMALAPQALAESKQEAYAGEWVSDMSRCQGGCGDIKSINLTIKVDGDKFHAKHVVVRTEKTEEFDYTYTTDGEPHSAPFSNRTTDRIVVAKWKGSKLATEYKAPPPNDTIDVKEGWKLKKGELYIKYTIGPIPTGGNLIRKRYYTRKE